MDFEQKDRGQLKEFFVKNAIPTERNFSDLIDASLNQQEDGIRKPDSSPLSIEASGDTQKVINFYPSFDDPDPAWSLALNPRSQAADPTTASGGFTITDGSGTPRLFIENSTGNVGIGSSTPQARLHIEGGSDTRLAGGGYLVVGSTDAKSISIDNNRLMARDNGKASGLSLQVDGGNVGIGTATPGAKLDINPAGSTWAGWMEAIRFSHREHSAITHPVGQLLFGLHKDRNFYFGDMKGKRYVLIVNGTNGNLSATGAIKAGNSDIYFTKTTHAHTGDGNTMGHAAIENDGQKYNALMILGRKHRLVTPNAGYYGIPKVQELRMIGMWDHVTIHGTFKNSSDAREKRDVVNLGHGLEAIKQLRPVSFNWKEIANPHKSMGLVAQEVAPIIAEAVYQDESGQDGHLSIAYTSLIPVLINAVKELDSEIKRLSSTVAATPS